MEELQYTTNIQRDIEGQHGEMPAGVSTIHEDLSSENMKRIKQQLKIPERDDSQERRSIVKLSLTLHVSILLLNVQLLLRGKIDNESLAQASNLLDDAVLVAEKLQDAILMARCAYWKGILMLGEGDFDQADQFFSFAESYMDQLCPEIEQLPRMMEESRKREQLTTYRAPPSTVVKRKEVTQVRNSVLERVREHHHRSEMNSPDFSVQERMTNRDTATSELFAQLLAATQRPKSQLSNEGAHNSYEPQNFQAQSRSASRSLYTESLSDSVKNFEGVDAVFQQLKEQSSRGRRQDKEPAQIPPRKVEPARSQADQPGLLRRQSSHTELVSDWLSYNRNRLPTTSLPPGISARDDEPARRHSSSVGTDLTHSPPSPQTRRWSESNFLEEGQFEADIPRPYGSVKPALRINPRSGQSPQRFEKQLTTPVTPSPLRRASLPGADDDGEE